LNNETVGENSANTIPLYQQLAEYQSYYQSQKKQQPHLNINNTTLISDVVKYYIGFMHVICVHCNAKHFLQLKKYLIEEIPFMITVITVQYICNQCLSFLNSFALYSMVVIQNLMLSSNIFVIIVVSFHLHHLMLIWLILKIDNLVHIALKFKDRFIIKLI